MSVRVSGSSSTTNTCRPGSTFTAAVDDSGLPCVKQLSKAVIGDVLIEDEVWYVEVVFGGWFSKEPLENDRGLGRGTNVGRAVGSSGSTRVEGVKFEAGVCAPKSGVALVPPGVWRRYKGEAGSTTPTDKIGPLPSGRVASPAREERLVSSNGWIGLGASLIIDSKSTPISKISSVSIAEQVEKNHQNKGGNH